MCGPFSLLSVERRFKIRFSQVAKAIWNNLVKDFDSKSAWDPAGSRLKCPADRNGDAFLSTFENSKYPEGAAGTSHPFAKLRTGQKIRRRRLMRGAGVNWEYLLNFIKHHVSYCVLIQHHHNHM